MSPVTGVANFYTDSQVTVDKKSGGYSAATRDALKQATLAMNYTISKDKDLGTGSYTPAKITAITGKLQTALQHFGSPLTGIKVQNVSITDDDNWSFEAYDGTGTYTVKIGAGADLETANKNLKNALDSFFNTNELKQAKDKTLTNKMVAGLVNADSDVKDALTDAAGNKYVIDGDGNALGSDGSGKLTITEKDSSLSTTLGTYTYTFTADVTTSDKTEAEANKEALATVNANTYPDYYLGGTLKRDEDIDVTHDKALLQGKILSDLKDAGYNTSGQNFAATGDTKENADKDKNGEYKNVITPNNDTVDVALTYSSDAKLLDTEKVLEKFLAKGGVKNANANTYTEHGATTSSVKLDDAATPESVYSYDDLSALSQKVQAKSAIKATSASDAADIVKAAIDEQLTAKGIADNGVKVTVKAVNKAEADGTKYDVTAASSDATIKDGGEVTLLVTASIKNDFYGWSDGTNKDEARTISYSYLMDIETNALKENNVKSISLADKTVLLSGGYYSDGDEVTYVEITPVIDPADANFPVTYKVFDSDKTLITDTVQVGKDDVYKRGSETAVKVGTNALGLKLTKAGTYTIKATADDAEATMKLTVKKNFDDVSATAYYKDAVVWAYGNGVTSGVTQDIFGVNTDVTRAQYVTWLYRYAVSQDSNVAIKDADVKSVFSDVAATAYYAKAVQWAKEAGVVDGKTDTTFAPDTKITRAEAITMLWRAYGKPSAGEGREDEATVKFTDVPANAYYTTAVTWAVNRRTQVTQGTSTTTFSPNKTCSRAEGITFIYRVYGY